MRRLVFALLVSLLGCAAHADDWGSVNNATSNYSQNITATWGSCGTFGASAGTLNSVSFWTEDNGGVHDVRIAVYQGGSAGTRNGATLVFFQRVTSAFGTGGAWITATAASQALAASTWTCIEFTTNNGGVVHLTDSASDGNLSTETYSSTALGSDSSATPPSPIAGDTTASITGGTLALKARLNFTVSGGGGGTGIISKRRRH